MTRDPSDQAARCRRLAKEASSQTLTDDLNKLAEEYEAEAQRRASDASRHPIIRTFEQPLDVDTCEGEVVLVGPGRLAGSLTVGAAEASIDRLRAAVEDVKAESEPEGEGECDDP